MNVSLTDQLSRFVNRHVASGRYQSASEVIREALRLLQERDDTRSATALRDVKRKIRVGLDQARRGELLDGEQVFRELEAKARMRKRK